MTTETDVCKKYIVSGEGHEPSEHESLSDAKAAAEASLAAAQLKER